MCKPARMGWKESSLIIKPVGVVSVNLPDCLPLPIGNDVHLSSRPKEYLGMLEYKTEDEDKLIQNLILGSETWKSECLLCQSLLPSWVGVVISLPPLLLLLAQSLLTSALVTR